jgi:hypothetical protein
MNDSFELVEKTSPKDSFIRIVPFHHIKRQILCPVILDSAKGYLEQNLSYCMNDTDPKAIQWCVGRL